MNTAIKIVDQVKTEKITPTQVVKDTIKDIKAKNGEVNAFLEIFEKSALEQAKKLETKISKKANLGKLAGVPIAIKDNIAYKGHRLSCGSKMLENFVSTYNSTVVEKLLEEDAIIIGRTNMDEFAMGSSCETSAFGPTKNPVDLSRVSGGSSGGSASAVANKMVTIALGSDTGGSIRQPASFCGVIGFKPSYGKISRYGLVAFSSSLDQIGPITNNIQDCELVSSVICGHDTKDSTSADVSSHNLCEPLRDSVEHLKIGLVKEFFEMDGLDKEIKTKVLAGVEKLKKAGAKIAEVSLPNIKFSPECYQIICSSEASSNLSRFDGIRYGLAEKKSDNLKDFYKKTRGNFGDEVKRRLMVGTYSLSAGYYDEYYLKAKKVQQLIKKDFEKAFKHVDIIITPTSPFTAFKIGEKIDDILQMYLCDIYTSSVNLAGIGAISLNCGYDKNNLPIGIQFICKKFDEKNLLNTAYTFEKINK